MAERPSLTARIRQAAEEIGNTDAALIARTVAEEIPEAERDVVLAEALLPLVRQVLSRDRPPAGFMQGLGAVSPVNSARSARVRGIRLAYLNAPYSVGSGRSKQLGDCTAEDLVYIARGLEVQGQKMLQKAEDMRRLALEVEERLVPVVRELPEDILMKIFPRIGA
jgi:hypothetical protein